MIYKQTCFVFYAIYFRGNSFSFNLLEFMCIYYADMYVDANEFLKNDN